MGICRARNHNLIVTDQSDWTIVYWRRSAPGFGTSHASNLTKLDPVVPAERGAADAAVSYAAAASLASLLDDHLYTKRSRPQRCPLGEAESEGR